MIRVQNDFLRNFRVIPVFGLLPTALVHEITITSQDDTETVQTVERFITSQPFINGIEITNWTINDVGKTFLKPGSANILQARAFVHTVIKQLYESGSIPAAMILSNFNPPRQGDVCQYGAT